MKKFSWLLVTILTVAVFAVPALAQNNFPASADVQQNASTSSRQLPPSDLTAGLKNQLIAAGFKNVEAVPAAANKFLSPVYYFRVQTTSTNTAWGDVANVTAIYITDTANNTWLYNKGETEVIDLAGRTQVRTSNLGQYIVVTGPERDKMVLLAHNLKVLQ